MEQAIDDHKSAKNIKKVTNAWCMYDWANSVYPLTITSAIFPIYWNSQTEAGVDLFGMHLSNSVLYTYCLSFSFLVIALVNPILSGIADIAGNKKAFMKAFVILGCLSCFGMSYFDSQHIWIGIVTFILGTIGFAGSLVFYNAYLPEIATEEHFDRLSAKGFSLGYIGGVILLIFNLALILYPELLFNVSAKSNQFMTNGMTSEEALKAAKNFYSGSASRLSFITVGVWWYLFSLIPFKYLPKSKVKDHSISITKGYKELRKVYAEVKKNEAIKKYLGAFFFYSMGVQTVMYVAAIFGDKELKLPTENLIMTILIIQLVAVLGAWLFSRLSNKVGNINALLVSVIIWVGVCIGAYFVNTINSFYLLATVVGSIMGGIQSLSRSTYAKLIPTSTHDTASYFSFYEFTEKVAIVLGTFSFGFIEFAIYKLTGETSMRYSVLSLMVFFIIGAILLNGIRKLALLNK
ncbi:MAG: MFS transporter [bacterium]|nr:MFS transporter [bacterium]